MSVKYATEHRCGVVLHGPGLCDRVTGTDPLTDRLPLLSSSPLDDSPAAARAAAAVNAASAAMAAVLEAHPLNAQRAAAGLAAANCVLLRGPGERIEVPPFGARHGRRACVVAPTKIIAGLAMSLGMEVLQVTGATGDYKTDLGAKADAMAAALSDAAPGGGFAFGLLHVKAVDDCGHDRNVPLKAGYLAAVDAMVARLALLLAQRQAASQERFVLAVTGDHSTPVLYGDHTCEPVPFVLAHVPDCVAAWRAGGGAVPADVGAGGWIPTPHRGAPAQMAGGEAQAANGAGVTQGAACTKAGEQAAIPNCGGLRLGDNVTAFDEAAAAAGGLGRFPGSEVMRLLCSFAETPLLLPT